MLEEPGADASSVLTLAPTLRKMIFRTAPAGAVRPSLLPKLKTATKLLTGSGIFPVRRP